MATLFYLLGRGDGTFDAAVALEIPAGIIPFDVVVASLDPGGTHVIVSSRSGSEATGVLVLRSRGRGQFDLVGTFAAPPSIDLTLADLDADRPLDIAVAHDALAEVTVLLQKPKGMQPPPQREGPRDHLPRARWPTTFAVRFASPS